MKTGARLPAIPVQQFVDGEVREIDLAAFSAGKSILLVAMPGAFTPPCSLGHLPGYLANVEAFKAKGIDAIVVLATSDFFVVKAWEDTLDADPLVHFVADGSQRFTVAAEQDVDLSDMGLGVRTQRYVAHVEDGKVSQIYVEPDATLVTVSAAEEMLKHL